MLFLHVTVFWCVDMSCQRYAPAPQRSKVTCMRATSCGCLWFVDHVELSVDQYLYLVLVIVDAASNLIRAVPQKTKLHDATLHAMELASDEMMVKPRAICGDQYFHEDKFVRYYRYHCIRL